MADQSANVDGVLDDTEYMLSTIDNPYNPFEDFNEWMAWDDAAGYHSSQLLANVGVTYEDMPESMRQVEINRAIDAIVSENILGVSRKVSRETYNIETTA